MPRTFLLLLCLLVLSCGKKEEVRTPTEPAPAPAPTAAKTDDHHHQPGTVTTSKSGSGETTPKAEATETVPDKRPSRLITPVSLAVSKDETWAATCGGGFIDDKYKFGPLVLVWKLGDRAASERQLSSKDLELVGPIAFSADGKKLAVLCKLKLIVWNLQDGSVVSVGNLPDKGFTVPDRIDFTPSGESVIVCAHDDLMSVRMSDGTVTIKSPKDAPVNLESYYSPALNRVVDVRFEDQTPILKMWDPGSDGQPKIVKLTGGATGSHAQYFVISGDGKSIAVCVGPLFGETKFRTSIHSTSDGKMIALLPEDDSADYRKYTKLALSNTGEYLAGIGSGGLNINFASLDLYRTSDGKRLVRNLKKEGSTEPLRFDLPTFTPDGKALLYYLTTNQSKKYLMKVDVATGKETAE